MNKYKLKLNNQELVVEFKNLAEQANGNVLVRYGDTMVLATAVMSKQKREGIDFLPLTVDYEEKYYAAGKIFGSRFIRRESRPSDEAVLTSRLIDRTIRPCFSDSIRRDIQIVVTCLSWDAENDPDVVGLLAASLALSCSDIPWSGPVGAVRIGRIDGNFVLNPNYEDREKSKLDIVLAAVSSSGNILINMIEAGAQEAEEKIVLDAVDFAKPYLQKIIDFQEQIIKETSPSKKEKIIIEQETEGAEIEAKLKEFLGNRLEDAIYPKDQVSKQELRALENEAADFIGEKYPGLEKAKYVKIFFEKEINRIIHQGIIKQEKRPDKRKLDELREIKCEVSLLPRTHGSGFFKRGQTHTLSILTLGAPDDQRLLQGMEIVGKKRFMHHYNFPPFSTGEVKPLRGPGRREIGHGMLGEKALLPVIPSFEDFPYTIRIVSEALSSNGSTSMASVCSSILALMDAGVPIKAPVAGIAMGLIMENGNYKILTDIQGPEDHYGDMDLKVAGTRKGITALQMDVKIKGINKDILKQALEKARNARVQILDKMEKVLAQPREKLSPFAPRIYSLQINPEKIRTVVGPGGKVINEIIDKCEVSIDIQPSGLIFITAEKEEAAQKAVSWIKNLTREVKVGEIFEGKVKKILDFGAFVEILPGQEGLVHISKLANHRVEKVEDVVKVGDIVSVKVISIDDQGRINLSLQQAKK